MKNLKKFIEKNRVWLILFVSMFGFSIILTNVLSNKSMKIDTVGYNFISKYLMSDFATTIFKLLTNLGGSICLIGLAILSLITIKKKKTKFCIMLNLCLSFLLNVILKDIIQRPRPTMHQLIRESGYSFPSGHSMISLAFYGFLIYLICKNVKDKKIKILFTIFLSIIIIFIGISRVYLGVHYVSDVIGGFLVSISYLIIYIKLVNRYIEY